MSVSPIVIKVGGALLDDTAAMTRLFLSVKDVQATPWCSGSGGGPLVETLMASLVFAKIDSLRVTPMNICLYLEPRRLCNKRLCAATLA